MATIEANVRVLVVDEQPVAALGIARCLTEHGFDVVGVVAGSSRLQDDVELHRAGMVVIEPAPLVVALGGAALSELVEACAVPFMAFTADISPMAVHQLLDIGMVGVVPRTCTPAQFIDGVTAVSSGTQHMHQRALSAWLSAVRSTQGSTQAPLLSARESQIVALIADGLTNALIAERLEISAATVKTHVERLLRKLGATDRAHAVSLAMRTGVLE